MTERFNVTFWGVRGSYPTPGAGTAQVGGNTPSIQVVAGSHQLIFDAGTGIIGLGRALAANYRADKKPIELTLFFTHTHHDHTQGFPFFVPARFQMTNLYIFGPKSLDEDLQQVLSLSMSPPVFPITLNELPCKRIVRNLNEGEVISYDGNCHEPQIFWSERDAEKIDDDNLSVRVMRSYAHPQGVYIYRVSFQGRSLVFATDVENYLGGDQRLIRFARGADLLIHDAQYTDEEYMHSETPRQGWGHSTWRAAIQAADSAEVKQLALFHHEPDHDDAKLFEIELKARALRPNTFLAREGTTVEI